jgi:hypothetical protein
MEPSGVKGTAIQSVVADVKRLVEEGRVSRDELEARLAREDLEILEEKILPSRWYSLGSYGRLTAILFEREGNRRTEYLLERGRRAAERLQKAGLYAQFSLDKERWGERVGKILVSLGPAIYRDTQWSYDFATQGEGISYTIEVVIPAEFPDLCRYQTQGFVEYLTCHFAPRTLRVSSERISPTRMRFHGRPL